MKLPELNCPEAEILKNGPVITWTLLLRDYYVLSKKPFHFYIIDEQALSC